MTRDELAIREALARAAQGPCLLCNRPASDAAIFSPFNSELWGAPPGKHRLCVYALCHSCFEGSTPEQCEAEFARRLGVAI